MLSATRRSSSANSLVNVYKKRLGVQADPPAKEQRSNWLPAPKGDISLYLRAYWPQTAITEGSWTPPAVVRVN